ncbi:LysR family transcriptional regulator [Zooshikella sp. RANM57]|uniref:LysR family transcriptional regulator n=1 Tax=Zooshikella sp. RANM57 TaxID=3425863 RepID=UPI003D6E9BF1
MLDDIVLFVHIVQQGGLAGAARYVNLPAATVTRRLKRLEQQLGCHLLHRTPRQCTLTQEGEVYYQTYVDLVEQFEIAQQKLSKDIKALRGKLKVLAPTNISHGFFRQMWLDFMRIYPEIRLELILSNQLQDMLKCRADIAIRIGPQPDSLLYQQKLGAIDKVFVASPEYLSINGEPKHPLELKNHRVVGTTLASKWKLKHIYSGEYLEITPYFSALFNDTGFVKYMVCDSQGISLLPMTEVITELESDELVQILPQWRGEAREIYVVWPSGRLLNEKAKCLHQHLQDYLANHLI